MHQGHIDLRYVLHNLGYKRGLKGCEKQFGISRDDLDGVDGYFAVLLWHEYESRGNHRALETLLAYNIEDVVNLEYLMHAAYNMKISRTPFAAELALAVPPRPKVPFDADKEILFNIKRKLLHSAAAAGVSAGGPNRYPDFN